MRKTDGIIKPNEIMLTDLWWSAVLVIVHIFIIIMNNHYIAIN